MTIQIFYVNSKIYILCVKITRQKFQFALHKFCTKLLVHVKHITYYCCKLYIIIWDCMTLSNLILKCFRGVWFRATYYMWGRMCSDVGWTINPIFVNIIKFNISKDFMNQFTLLTTYTYMTYKIYIVTILQWIIVY